MNGTKRNEYLFVLESRERLMLHESNFAMSHVKGSYPVNQKVSSSKDFGLLSLGAGFDLTALSA